MNETTTDKASTEVAGQHERLVMPLHNLLNSCCVYCEKPAQGNYAIHRDGFGLGPEVPLCDECEGSVSPSCEQIWKHISEA